MIHREGLYMDPYDDLCFYLNKIKKYEMAAASSVVEFSTIETSMFEIFTAYVKLVFKHVLATALTVDIHNFCLSLHLVQKQTDEKINCLMQFRNDKIQKYDEKKGMGIV